MEQQDEASVYVEYREELAIIRLNRPKKRNAMNFDMWELIADLVRQCEQDDRIKVIVFSGVDTSVFSAGADISEFEFVQRSRTKALRYNQAIMATEFTIMNCPKPTIAMIYGACVGGGCAIALACDFRFSADNGIFGITPAKLGILYNLPGTKNAVDLIGPSRTRDLLYTGRLLNSDEACRIGLIDRVHPVGELETQTYEYARTICRNAQNSIRGAKQIIRDVLYGQTANSDETDRIVTDAFTSDNFREGIEAFMGKRSARFR